jgi:Tol biopolymer transport system component
MTRCRNKNPHRIIPFAAIAFILTSTTVLAAPTSLISTKSKKIQSNGVSAEPATSATGQFVAFRSSATNLDGERCKNGLNQIFVRDRNTGTVRCVSLNSNGREGDQDSRAPAISADGRFIAFTSAATNLTGDDCDNGFSQIFLRDITNGTTTCLSVNSNGRDGNQHSDAPSISADGTLIAFDSAATNLTGSKCDNGFHHIFVRDVTGGTTTCVSVRTNGDEGNGDSFDPSISADGRFVVFQSTGTNLATRCNNGNSHVYMHNLTSGETTCVSVNSAGQQSNGNSGLARISGDGRFVVFQSNPTNLTARCINGFTHVFVRDTIDGRTSCASLDNAGEQGNNDSTGPSISSNGRFVAFSSAATNLTGKRCTGGSIHVFVRDRLDEETKCASVGPKKVEGNGESINPSLSANGALVAFESGASNLVKKDTNGLRDVFGHVPSFSDSNGGSSVTITFDGLQLGDITITFN